MTDTDELRTEGLLAIAKNMRIGHYCLEAADEIERLRDALRQNLGIPAENIIRNYKINK